MLVWDGTEVSTPSLDDVPSARRVILRMAATALVVLVLVALGGVVAASRLAERDAIHSGADIVGLLADAVVQPHVTDAVVAGDPAALAELDAATANPAGVAATVRANLRGVQSAGVVDAVAAVAQRKLSYLAKHAPTPPIAAPLSRAQWRPAPAEIDRFARRVRAANDPIGVLDDVSRGVVTAEAVDTLREVYPRLYEEARAHLLLARLPQVRQAPVGEAHRLQAAHPGRVSWKTIGADRLFLLDDLANPFEKPGVVFRDRVDLGDVETLEHGLGGNEQAKYGWNSADGTPIVGASRYRNLWFNTGHGTLGWTMACGSAAALADLIDGRHPVPDFPFLQC